MKYSVIRREANIIHNITEWIKGDHTNHQIVLMLSLIVGLCSGLAAFILKYLVEEIKHLLTNQFNLSETNGLYMLYPAIGILITALFVKYVVKDDISHGVTKILYAISRKRARIKGHNRWTSIVASSITIGFGGSVGAEAPIVLTGSAHAWGGQKDRTAYACSKGVLRILMEHISHQYATEHIRCNYLTLGWTPTEGEVALRNSQGESEAELRKRAADILPMGRMCERNDYMEGLIYLMSDASSMMTGSTFRLTAGEYI